MTDQLLTANEVVIALSKLGTELDATVTALKQAELDAATKRHEADQAESRAFVSSDGSMDLRKHLARLAAGKQEQEAVIAEAVCRYLRTRIRAIETRVEIGRSYNAAIRAELAALPYDQQP